MATALKQPDVTRTVATAGFTDVLDSDSILDALYGDRTTLDLVSEAHAVALKWSDELLVKHKTVGGAQDECSVTTGRLLQVLLEQASKDPIPGLGGVTGERYTASLIVVGDQADSGASQASADKVDSHVRRIALSWLDKMLFCGTSLQRPTS